MAEFYGIYDPGKGKAGQPWMVLKTEGAHIFRWVPRLKEWVEIPDHWDYIYDSVEPHRKMTEAEIRPWLAGVVDVPDDFLAQWAKKK